MSAAHAVSAMRIISFSDFHADATPIYKANNILKLRDFISLQNCIFVHDFLKNNLPFCFGNYFQPVNTVHGKGTISNQLGCLFVPHSSTKNMVSILSQENVSIAGTFSPKNSIAH